MEFKLATDSTPQEIPLNVLNTVSNSNWDGEKGQKISRQIRKSDFNQSGSTTLCQI
jgi:hypothetical protein